MSEALKGLQPELLWKYFGEISRIPRCSKNEQAISAYVVQTAQRLGLQARQDGFGNVVVKKPAAPGFEASKTVVLQGHLDMVCEKNAEKVHDFSRDPIEIVRKDNVLMADGTTLGADNGIAVATCLAVMEDRTLEHGALEFLFTIDEETGLTGAANLQEDFIEGRTLLNLDSEEEGEIFVGCAGGRDTTGVWKVDLEDVPQGFTPLQVLVKGLRGGHSGLEIHSGRGNAIKILNRLLLRLTSLEARLAAVNGGNKRNAIPREAQAVVLLADHSVGAAELMAQSFHDTVKAELGSIDPDVVVRVFPISKDAHTKVMSRADQQRLCRTVAGLPHGVLKMSSEVPGLVETSNNVAVISTGNREVVLATSQRSPVASEIEEAAETVSSIMLLGGANVTHSTGYPGWKPNLSSPVLELAKTTYRRLFDRDPQIKAVHAGLECGIIGEKYPGMDMISFGPTMQGVHSPEEKLFIDTVPAFWTFLLAILKNV